MEHLFRFRIIRHRIFTQFLRGGSCTENLTVVDSAGSIYCKQITVYVVDTTPADARTERTTRFIDEKYYGSSYERGGFWMIRSGRRILRTCLHFGRRLEIWKMMHRLKPIRLTVRRAGRSANMWMRTDSETAERSEHYRKCMIGILCQIV